MNASSAAPLLSVRDLTVSYGPAKPPVLIDVAFRMSRGESVAIVGESGSGKSTLAMAIAGLLPQRAVRTGEVLWDGKDLATASPKEMRSVLGSEIGLVYQDGLRALNPVLTVGKQIEEVLASNLDLSRSDRRDRVRQLLTQVGITEPGLRRRQHPHQFSGGMRQRTLIAMGIGAEPQLLIADEPTTALDVTLQAQILALIRKLRDEQHMSLLLVTHDLGVVAETCDRVIVMYRGRVLETGAVDEVMRSPQHPYTAALLEATPDLRFARSSFSAMRGQPQSEAATDTICAFIHRCTHKMDVCETEPAALASLVRPGAGSAASACIRVQQGHLDPGSASRRTSAGAASEQAEPRSSGPERDVILEARALSITFATPGGATIRAVDDVSFSLTRGQSLAIVGESGSGKSTIARAISALERPSAGSVSVDGHDLYALSRKQLRTVRTRVQMVFQDPRSSLNPKRTIASLLDEASRRSSDLPGIGSVDEAMELVGIPTSWKGRYPNELSGGQSQRVAIARALLAKPLVLVADEAVSSLDVSIQGQILALLRDVQRELGVALVFVSHDLAVARDLCERVLVLYLGTVVEHGRMDRVFSRPSHPYTAALLSAAPIPDPAVAGRERILLLGEPPSPFNTPSGCRFHTRCPIGPSADRSDRAICSEVAPELVGDVVARARCHFPGEIHPMHGGGLS